MVPIKQVGAAGSLLQPTAAQPGRSSANFHDTLKNCIQGVDKLQKDAEHVVGDIASGKLDNVHQAMVAMEKADVSFRLMVEARNRIVSAYEQIIKMQG